MSQSQPSSSKQSSSSGTPGFWQDAFSSFLKNDSSTQFTTSSEITTSKNVSPYEEVEDQAGAELYAIRTTEGDAYNCNEVHEKTTNTRKPKKIISPDSHKSVKVAHNSKLSQQKRRDFLLFEQQQRRDNLLEKIRNLEKDSIFSDSEIDEDEDFVQIAKRFKPNPICEDGDQNYTSTSTATTTDATNIMETNTTGAKKKRNKRGSNKASRKDQLSPYGLMSSEWLNEKPEDFEENWLGILCPVGKRCMVVTTRGKTYVFSRKNEYIGVFESLLPGGHRVNRNDPEMNRMKGITILDCFWSAEATVFFVLDMLSWNSYSCNNCDKDFRQYFQTSKFSENPDIMQRIPFSNPFPFLPLPAFTCDRITEIMTTTMPIFNLNVDGVLFFHKQSFYYPNTNPFCLWAYLTEMEERLQVSVSPELISRQAPHQKRIVKIVNNKAPEEMEDCK